jgi:deoxycytidylate deaminase
MIVTPTMNDSTTEIEFPELFFGFVAPIGADTKPTLAEFRKCLEARSYRVVEIKVTDVFRVLQKYFVPKRKLDDSSEVGRYETYIAYGNQLRSTFQDDILAATAIRRIMAKRLKVSKPGTFQQLAFLVHQFKRKEEIELLRAVYGRLFFQVSVYSRRGARVEYLSQRFARSENRSSARSYRDAAEALITRDENEVEERHGQRVASIFHDADFIVSTDAADTPDHQVRRFCELLFGSNAISPSKAEYGLFVAKAAALRTLDLSRQVGAAIFSDSGEIVALGSNEVPKAGGGTYWSDEMFDDRDFVRGKDSNDERKQQILGEIARLIDPQVPATKLLKNPKIRDSQLMDALEYGRVVHAEMSALSDAARSGRAVKDAILYCTTFPCHMCAKHIVAAGISKVIFLEPYPKSLAFDLHSDSIQIEGGDRGHYHGFPSVKFEHFYGVSPRRYREIFERGKRKDDLGRFVPYRGGKPAPIVEIRFPFYSQLEKFFTAKATRAIDAAKHKRRRSNPSPRRTLSAQTRSRARPSSGRRS